MKLNLHSILHSKDFFQLLYHFKSQEIFFFKSKYSDLIYLGIEETKENNSTYAFIGNFEGDHKKINYKYNLFYKDGKLSHNLTEDLFNFEQKDISKNIFIDKTPLTSIEKWTEQINSIKSEFQKSHFLKLVLSRDSKINFDNLDEKTLLKSLLEVNNHASDSYFIFYKNKNDSFISFTPEMLISKNNDSIESIALASSMPRTNDELKNSENENYLLSNQKLIDEHTLVTLDIASIFNKEIATAKISPVEIMKLSYIMHRMQKISSVNNSINIDQLVSILHPTPAVGSMPRLNGIQTINNIENKKRGYYAAPFGVVFDNNCEIAVGLRSATIKNNTLTLHSGCGIINESDPNVEWDETENKMKPFLKAIL